jgi:TolB-like protein/tetratricopeptide (TPR) repeat protein/class 3 adenylate cyclase
VIPEASSDVDLEIAHVLFMDIVGYSKLPTDQQRELLNELNKIVRETPQFKQAEAVSKLIRLPTGDGMALAFFSNPEAALKCAIEISKAVGQALPPVRQSDGLVQGRAGGKRRQSGFRLVDPYSSERALALQLRMGLHSGPVSGVTDVNDRSNVAGVGINIAQRVMDCGDAGHILLSSRIADDLAQQSRWRPSLHELGPVEVKHGVKVEIVNFYTDEVGNPELPDKVKRAQEEQRAVDHRAASVSARKWWLMICLLLVVVAAAIAGFWLLSHRVAPKPSAIAVSIPDKSIAVLPLDNLSEEKENAFFADGIQEELLSSLAKIKDLKVISRTSVMQYKTGITRNLKEIAQQLGVSNVIEGSVRRSGNHIRVSVQLIDALTDRHIWVQDYDRTMADSLALQGELATEIAAGVGATLSPQEKARVEATPTKNTAAYQAYLRGRALMTGLTADDSNLEEAPRSFEEAVRLDPGFALGWVYLSCADSTAYWRGIDSTPARLAAAKDAVDHAVALDPNLPETHLALGYYRFYGLRDFSGALAEFELAEKNLPNNVDVLRAIGLIQRRFAHWDEAIAVLRRVVELDPRNTESASVLAITYMAKRHFADALAVADHILGVEPSNPVGIEMKTYCLWAMGKPEAAAALLTNPGTSLHLRAHHALNKRNYVEAADLLSKRLNENVVGDEKKEILLHLGLAQQRAGDVAASKATYQRAVQEVTQELSTVTENSAPAAALHSWLGIAYAGLGNAGAAVSEGQKGMALQPTSEDPFEGPNREEDMAKIYTLLGDADHAIPILQRLIQMHAPTEIVPSLLRMNAVWDPIRDDPRFQELVSEKRP